MSANPKRWNFTRSQFASLRLALGLEGTPHENISIGQFILNIDIIEFKDDISVYHMFNYKTYFLEIDSFWKRIRGVIIKDYTKIVCGSISATPNLIIDKPL